VVRALADTLARRPHAARGPAVDSPFACAFCGQARARELFAEAVREAQGYHVVRCERCGLVATHPRAAREAIPAFYGGQYYGPENAKFGPLTEGFVFLFRVARLRALRLMGIRRGAILDLGCGNGLFLRVVERAGYSAWGTELSDAAAAAARRLFGARIRTGPLADCGFAAGQFDAVTAWHVFEHLPDPRSTLRECHRILRPGGGLLLAVPNIESCQARWAGASWFHLDLPRHLFHYGPATLTAMLEAEGFRVERMSHYSLEQNPFALLQSALHRLGRPHHGLYALLRGPLDRTRRLRLRRLPAYTAYLASFPAAAAATYLGSWLGSGATISVLARRVEAPPGPVT
jgi:2-polyprenyl-3-methyl-5-hydroxy-6-metoxy-1,4-benzoquinol methylase